MPPFALAGTLRLEGHYTEGGLVFGKTEPSAVVQQDGTRISVSPQGDFVIGFHRDAPPVSTLMVIHPSGERDSRVLTIARRDYRIERIDGLPPGKVTPNPALLKRIRHEAALARAARERDAPRTDYLTGFQWPAHGRISGVYGSQRILNGVPKQPHYGVDIAAPPGTAVLAPADGVVTLAYPDMYYSGATLIIDHGHGLSSTFLHLKRILVKRGQRVRRGAIIAEVGASGRATGPHLDWRMNLFDKRIDPALLVGPMTAD